MNIVGQLDIASPEPAVFFCVYFDEFCSAVTLVRLPFIAASIQSACYEVEDDMNMEEEECESCIKKQFP